MVDWSDIRLRQRLSRADSGIFYVTLANLGTAVLGAALWFLLALFVTPSQYGEINYYISIGAIASLFGVFGLSTLNTTYLSKKLEQDLNGIYFTSLVLALGTSAVVGILTLSFFTAFLAFAIVTFSMSTSISLGTKNYKEFMLLMILERGLRIALVIGMYQILGLQGVILGYALAYLIMGYKFFHHLSKSVASFRIIRAKRGFALHSLSMDLSNSSNIFFDKLIIAPLFGFALLGLYQISTQFLMVLAIIPSSLFFYLLPKEAAGDKSKSLRIIALGSAVLFALIFFFAAETIVTMFFPKYINAVPLVQIAVFGIIPMTAISSSNSRLLGSGNSKYVFVGAFVYLAVQFSGIMIFGSIFNEQGLSIALLVALSIQAAFLKITEFRLSRIRPRTI